MRRDREMFLPPIAIDRNGSLPLHRQISRQMSEAIRRGTMTSGRLPSSRTLARLLGVSRNTVLTAFDELAADGLIRGRRGAATLVTPRRTTDLPDLRLLLRDAQYPARTIEIRDPDGAALCLVTTDNFRRNE